MFTHASRLIAIGDIHGCSSALDSLLKVIQPTAADTLVTLGDYVNRGPGSRGVIERLIALDQTCRLIPLLGNHDQMLLEARRGTAELTRFLDRGGAVTLRSYGTENDLAQVPAEHWRFLESCRDYFEAERHFFVHAQYLSRQPLSEQPVDALRWFSLRDVVPLPHCSGKTAIVGHTPQENGQILDLGHLICIDTACVRGAWLTALEPETGRYWQASTDGLRTRTSTLRAAATPCPGPSVPGA